MVLWIGRWPWWEGADGEKRHISQTSGSQNPWTQHLMGLEAVGRAGKSDIQVLGFSTLGTVATRTSVWRAH